MGLKPPNDEPRGTPSVAHETASLLPNTPEARLRGQQPTSTSGNLEGGGSPEGDKQKDSVTVPCLVRDVPFSPARVWVEPQNLSSRGAQEGARFGGWGRGGLRGLGKRWSEQPELGSSGAHNSQLCPSLAKPRVRTRRYLPARGSGEHPRLCGRRAAPRLRAPTQAAAGRAPRGLRLAPPHFPSPSVGRGGSGDGQARSAGPRPPEQEPPVASDGSRAPQCSLQIGSPRPAPPNAERRARPGHQSPLPPPPEPGPQPPRGRGARI